MIKFVIPLQPISKKNSQQIFINSRTGKPFIAPSKKYKEYEQAAGWFIPKRITINTPVNIKCLFYMKNRQKCDLTNMLEAIDDVMVKVGFLVDDNYTVVAGHDGSRIMHDKVKPRTEVYVEFLKDGI